MSLMLDHVVILVNDLAQAVIEYQHQGFTVVPGGTHADGLTHNALIVLNDGVYLELIAFVDPDDLRDNIWGWRSFVSKGGGLIDYCVASDDLAKAISGFHHRGLTIAQPTDGGRQRTDGTNIQWRSARFWQTGRELPFLIEDVTQRELRVPTYVNDHTNGICGIAELLVAVADLPRVASLLGQLLNVPVPSFDLNRRYDAQTASFSLGQHIITLATPNSRSSPLQQRIETLGLGPCAISWAFRADRPTSTSSARTWFGLQHK